jgi:hypothetical protein
MVGTFTELQTRVQTRIIDLPSQVLAEVPQLINEALYELQSRHNFKVMERELYAYTQYNNHTLQTGTPFTQQPPLFPWPANATISPLATPSTLKEWRGRVVYILYNDGTPRFVNITSERTNIYGAFTEWDPSFPSVILDSIPSDNANDRTLEVYPLPDGLSDWPDGEYRLLLPYYSFLPTLVNGSDSNWLTTNPHGERFIIASATAEGFSLDWDTQNESKWKQKAELEYKHCVMADKKYRLGEVNELAIHSRGQYASRIRN